MAIGCCIFGLKLLGTRITSSDTEGNWVNKISIHGGSKKKDEDKLIKAATTTTTTTMGAKGNVYTPEFSDYMVHTPNYEIKAHPQSLIGSPLHYTCPNRLENWSSKSSTASNPLHPTNQIDRIQSSQTAAPPWRSKINPVQKDH